MADTTYNVDVKYKVDTSGVNSAISGLTSSFNRLEAAIAGAFTAHKVIGFAKNILDLQSKNEQFRISLATMLTGFDAPGFTKGAASFQDAMASSAELMKQIRKDAAELPGTAEDMMLIMQQAMPAGIRTGHAVLGAHSTQSVARMLMVASQSIPGGATTVSREFAAMMEGRAITRNDLFARIRSQMDEGKGMNAKQFNALSEKQRWDEVEKVLAKIYGPSLGTYAKTWETVKETTVNWVQQLARVATSPLFESLKNKLQGLNDWIAKDQSSAESMLATFGASLNTKGLEVFDSMKSAFSFLVEHRGAIIPVLEAAAVLMVGGKLQSGFGKKSISGALEMAMLGGTLNTITGGDAVTGIEMGLAGAMLNLGGVVGGLAATFLGLQAATNVFSSELDKIHKSNIDRHTEAQRIMPLFKQFETSQGGMSTEMYEVGKQIIQENRLALPMGQGLDSAKFGKYYVGTDLNQKDDSFHSAYTFLNAVAQRMFMENFATPMRASAAEEASNRLYERANARPETPKGRDVNVTVNIRQDISQAEDPDRILVRTKQAIEDALIRPIESGTHRSPILR